MDKLELSKSEIDAVQSYIWNQVRSSPTGKGYKVWEKMWKFLNDETEPEPEEPTVKAQADLF